jgi:hypothetical protein
MRHQEYHPIPQAATPTDLEDHAGTLYLVTEDDAGNRERIDLGPIEDASWDVPAALLGRYDDLLTDHRDMARYHAGYLAGIEATYRSAKGA